MATEEGWILGIRCGDIALAIICYQKRKSGLARETRTSA
jgi:hypothetical protein